MLSMNFVVGLLAQAEGVPPAPEASPMGPFMVYLMGGLAIFMVVNLLFGRSDSKEKARRDTFIGGLKKNDTVVTIGGIIGTVASISEDKSEVTIKVDDTTRLKMQASAIRELPAQKAKETKPKAGEASGT